MIKYKNIYNLTDEERKKLIVEILPILEQKTKEEIDRAYRLLLLKEQQTT